MYENAGIALGFLQMSFPTTECRMHQRNKSSRKRLLINDTFNYSRTFGMHIKAFLICKDAMAGRFAPCTLGR
jgi:hypothetical protein